MKYLLGILITSIVYGQISFMGYLESEYSTQFMENENLDMGHYRMRFDVEMNPIDDVQLFIDIENQINIGQTLFNLASFYPKSLDSLNRSVLAMMPYQINDSLSIMNMYGIYTFKDIEITLGRQPLSFGTGYAWNPVDVFNHKDFLNPAREIIGIDAMRVRWQVLDRFSLDGITTLGNTFDTSDMYLEAKIGMRSMDISVLSSKNRVQSLQYDIGVIPGNPIFNIPSTIYPRITYNNTERNQYGLTFSADVFGLGIHGEFGRNTEATDTTNVELKYDQFLLGLDYTFRNGLYVMVEMLRNENGLETIDDLDIQRYLQYMTGEHLSLFQNYSFVNMSYGLNRPMILGVFGIYNHDDSSFTLAPNLEWTINDYLVFKGLIGLNGGDKKSEFGMFKGYTRFQLIGYF